MKLEPWHLVPTIAAAILGLAALGVAPAAASNAFAPTPAPPVVATPTPRPAVSPTMPASKFTPRSSSTPRDSQTISINSTPVLTECVRPGSSVNITWTVGFSGNSPTQATLTIIRPDISEVIQTIVFTQTVTSPYTSDPVTYTIPDLAGVYYAEVEIFYPGAIVDRARIHFTVGYCGNLDVLKFNDLNGNGVRDGTPLEPPIPDWSITVDPQPGSQPATRLTDSTGHADWYDIPVGTYTVSETVPACWSATTPTLVVTLIVTDSTSYVAFGNRQTGTLRVFKFEDINGDGVQNGTPLEPPLAGWSITITSSGGASLTRQTGPDGWAIFDNILLDTYTVVEASGGEWWAATTPTQVVVNIAPCGAPEVIFGNRRLGSLTVCKFVDHNGNGQQEVGDEPKPGWSMTVDPPPDYVWNFQHAKLTGTNGCVTWDHIPIGNYLVTEDLPPYWRPTTPPNPRTNVPVTQGATRTEVFGNQPLGDLVVCKFVDSNGNGTQDPGEPMKAGWNMTVDPPAGYFWPGPSSQATDANGCAYWYKVPAATLPASYTVTEEERQLWELTTPPNPRRDAEVRLGETTIVRFGNHPIVVPPPDLVGRKTDDTGHGLQGWTIHAKDCSTGVELTPPQITDAGGNFRFAQVPGTCYIVWEEMQPGWQAVSPSSVTVHCTQVTPVDARAAPRSVLDVFSVFLPFVGRGGSSPATPAAPTLPTCERADFVNRQLPFIPKGVAVDLVTHRVYIGDRGQNTVVVADVDRTNPLQPSLKQVGDPIPVGNQPFGIAVDSLRHKVYVANYGEGSVTVIDGNTNQVITTIRNLGGQQPTYVGINTADNRIYVPLHADAKLAIIDGNTYQVQTRDVGVGAFGIAVDRGHCRAYVSSRDSLWVRAIDICNGDQLLTTERIDLGPAGGSPHTEPYALEADSDLQHLYVLTHTFVNGVPNENAVPEVVRTYPIPVPLTPAPLESSVEPGGDQRGVGIAVDTMTHNVFVTNNGSDSISCFNGENPPGKARWIAQASDGRFFESPMLIAADPGYGYIFVTDQRSGNVTLNMGVGIIVDGPGLCP